MSLTAGHVIIDASTLKDFAVVGRLDLIKERFHGRAHWTETIQRETARLGVADTEWLGQPIEIGGDSVATIIQVMNIREALGARPTDPAGLHLGEAEVIHYLETSQPSWTLVSDDHPAVDFAQHRRLSAVDTQQVVADCYESGQIGCPDAFELLLAMQVAGRGVRVPPSHWYICPSR